MSQGHTHVVGPRDPPQIPGRPRARRRPSDPNAQGLGDRGPSFPLKEQIYGAWMSPQGPPADPCIPPARQRVRDHRPVRTRPPTSETDKGRPRYRPTGHWCHSVTITVSLKLQPTNGECRTRLPTLLPLNSTQKNSNNQKKIRKQKKNHTCVK